MTRVAIVGGGAAGLLAGIAAAWGGAQVTIYEKMRVPGKKMLITGKGRCNITNACEIPDFIKNLPGNGRFLNSALHRFTNDDIVLLLESNGLPTKVERGGRIFPVSDKAKDVVDTLVRIYTEAGGKLQTDTKVIDIMVKEGHVYGVRTVNGVYEADRVILAAGRRLISGHRQRRRRRQAGEKAGAHDRTAEAFSDSVGKRLSLC